MSKVNIQLKTSEDKNMDYDDKKLSKIALVVLSSVFIPAILYFML